MTQAGPTKVCRRCKDKEAFHTIRADPLCSDCFCRFVATKTVKRLEVLNRETRSSHSGRGNSTRTFHVGLSFGPSSAALVDTCEQIILGQLAKNRDAAFILHVVHVDTELERSEPASPARAAHSSVEQRLDRWRKRYPRFTFERVPLAEVLALETIDWAALAPSSTNSLADGGAASEDQKRPRPRPSTTEDLRVLIANLPSATSRRDVLDLLVRRLLISRAATHAAATAATAVDAEHPTLLLGCTTTALAERTLTETAKGRGFSLPWQINDGPIDDGEGHQVSLYYPMRELFRSELILYTSVVQPPLSEGDYILPSAASSAAANGQAPAVISHKDLSIEEVMTRYFAEVEANYPSIVANVVRTTAKLERHGHGHGHVHDEVLSGDEHALTSCRVCGMPLDEAGNERWKGEIGRREGPEGGLWQGTERLCYGCERSIHG